MRALLSSLPTVLLVSTLFTAACSSGEPSSPTAPSAAGRSPRGAVITGRVTGISTGAATESVFTPLATTRLTVTIVGTDISTTVDGNGQFTLTGVPPGNVSLKFSGSGVDATITLNGVTATDRITITVAVNGKAARLESERRDRDDDEDDDDDENELEGRVSNLTGTCPSLTFTVQNTTVKTNGTTKFEGRCERIANGRRVEVEGHPQADSTFMASKVEIDD